MKRLTEYFISRPALNISALEREMKRIDPEYPLKTLKLALNPKQEKEFPSKWIWLLAKVLETYGNLEVDGWIVKPDEVPNVFILERDNEKEVWDLADLMQMVLNSECTQ